MRHVRELFDLFLFPIWNWSRGIKSRPFTAKEIDTYDTFFIDNKQEFRYVGCPNEETRRKLKSLIVNAVGILERKVDGKYPIQNDIDYDF